MPDDATSSSGVHDSDWRSLPPELLKEIAQKLVQEAEAAQIGRVRTTCRAWRQNVTAAVESIHVRYGAHDQAVSNLLTKCTQLQQLHHLPTSALQYIHPVVPLRILSLSGTGTDLDYCQLAKLTSLQRLRFLGPVTLTSERFCILGQHPGLTCLAFDNVLFPRTQYGEHACKSASFPSLERLELLGRHSLTRNGLDSSRTARQLLSALKALKSLTIDARTVRQVLLQTLDELPLLKEVCLLGDPEPMFIDQWVQWASPKLVQVSLHGQLICPYVAWT